MIPIIGIMMGTYIFTKMISLASKKDEGAIIKILAILTCIVAVCGSIGLLLTGV